MQRSAIILFAALLLTGHALAADGQTARIGPGAMQIRFNMDRLAAQAVQVTVRGRDLARRGSAIVEFPLLADQALDLQLEGGGARRYGGGSLAVDRGFKLHLRDGAVDLRRFTLRPSADPRELDVVAPDGQIWFVIRHQMPRIRDGHFVLRSADLVATAAFAERAAAPTLTGAYVGEVKLDAEIQGDATSAIKSTHGGPNFHGTGSFVADVLLDDYTMQFLRCRTSAGVNGCNGPGGDDGEVVFAPSSTLRNSDTATTADVPWYEKFQTSPYNYPFPGNDQHPYLVWNLYRINDGQLQQIGASGLKHAFLTTNFGCSNPYGNNVLSRNCGDTYGTGSNDSTADLGARTELIPHTGRWGRCGSGFDSNCDAQFTSADSNWLCAQGNPQAECFYRYRLRTRESQLELSGSTFYSDSWYVVLDDVNIYNTMAHRSLTLNPLPNVWFVATEGSFTPGSVVDSWVNPLTNPTQNVELVSGEGRVKLAVKVKSLPACPVGSGLSGSCYRYDYAIHNLSLARAVLNTSAPADPNANLQVLSNTGIITVAIPRGSEAGVYLDSGHFADIDTDAANDWVVSLGSNAVTWTAPAGNSLNWAQLFRFSLVSNAAPDPSHTRPMLLGMQSAGGPASYSISIMVPNSLSLFANGWE